MLQADYVVVGAGSAGCVLADRLSEDGSRVVLLEAGPRDLHPMIHVPAGILHLIANPLVNWNYWSEPEEGTGNRPIHWPRGRVLGGSSSINGMLYVRGNPADYDGWAQMGCRGWSYDEVLPVFKRSESYRGAGEDDYRGREGPLVVEDYRTILDITHRFVEAAQQAGYEFSPDLNGRQPEGVGYSQMSRDGRFRASTARAFLSRAKKRANLIVETGAQATRLSFEGRRCTGISYRKDGMDLQVRATREVILSGGSVNSPHILQVSGIGPAEHLKSIGVEVLHDLPGVGGNLSDHYVARIAHRLRGAESINELSRGGKLLGGIAKWAFQSKGQLTFGVTAAQVFTRSRDGLASPDLQLLFTPASYDQNQLRALEREPGMTVAVCPVRPDSRGTIMAESPDPLARPIIRPNYLSELTDRQAIISGMRKTREILAAPALAAHSAFEIAPGKEVQSDDELLDFARHQGSVIYHPVGTCKMGVDPLAVVDPRLKVHGLEGLRVIDASIMPTVTTGNTNAPTIMIGEKGAEMIREDWRG